MELQSLRRPETPLIIVGFIVLLGLIWSFAQSEGESDGGDREPSDPPLHAPFVGGPGDWARGLAGVHVHRTGPTTLPAEYRDVCVSARFKLSTGAGEHHLVQLATRSGDPLVEVNQTSRKIVVRGMENGTTIDVPMQGSSEDWRSLEICRSQGPTAVALSVDDKQIGEPRTGPPSTWGTGAVTIGEIGSDRNAPTFRDIRIDDHPGDVDHRPSLADLKIIGTGLAFKPGFSPDVLRYALYPSGNTEGVEVTPIAGKAAATILIDGREVESGGVTQLTGLASGDTVDIDVVALDGTSKTYQLVYLPVAFPVIEATSLDATHVTPGPIYLSLPVNPSQPRPCIRAGSPCYVVEIDDRGVPIYYRQEADPVRDFKLQPGGLRSYLLLLPPDVRGGHENSQAVILDSSYEEVARARAFGLSNTNGHDFLIRRDGSKVFLSFEQRTGNFSDEGGPPAARFFEGIVQEVDPQGNVTFEWDTSEHVPLSDSYRSLPDPFHINSVVVAPDGDFIVSERGINQVIRIDRTTGEIVWRLGGDSSDFQIVADPLGGFCGQHTASLLPNGNILLFDNGQALSGGLRSKSNGCQVSGSDRGRTTRVVEYALDEETMIATLVWSYWAPTFAPAQGSAQRLPSGNTMVGWGVNDAGLLASEIDPAGNEVFKLQVTMPDGSRAFGYRVFRFPI